MRERAFSAFVELLSGKLSLKTLTYNVNFMFYLGKKGDDVKTNGSYGSYYNHTHT